MCVSTKHFARHVTERTEWCHSPRKETVRRMLRWHWPWCTSRVHPRVPRPAANHRLNWADRQAGYIHPCTYCWGHGIQLRAHTACAPGNKINESTSRLRRGDTLPARPTSWWCEQQTNMLEMNPVAWDKQWTVSVCLNLISRYVRYITCDLVNCRCDLSSQVQVNLLSKLKLVHVIET